MYSKYRASQDGILIIKQAERILSVIVIKLNTDHIDTIFNNDFNNVNFGIYYYVFVVYY